MKSQGKSGMAFFISKDDVTEVSQNLRQFAAEGQKKP
jgi:hypothetical protein